MLGAGLISAARRRTAGALSAVSIAVQDFQTGTTLGSVSYPSTTLAGLTPKAALLFMNQQVVAHEPSGSSGASVIASLCLNGSGSGRSFRTLSESAAAATNVRRVQWLTSSFLQDFNSNASNFEVGGTPTLVSGGVNIDYGRASVNKRGVYIAFAGADLQSAGGEINLGTGTSAISVSTGFRPDAVIFLGCCTGSDNSGEDFFTYSFGLASWDGSTLTQRCVLAGEADALADSAPRQAILTSRCGGQIDTSTGGLSYHVTASSFTSSGFSVTPSANTGSDRLHYLALNLGGRRAKVVDFTTPTSTGDFTISGAGFTPSFALAFVTALESVDPTFPISSSDLMGALGTCSIGSDEQWSLGYRINALEPTTSTGSIVRNSAMVGPSATSLTAFVASFVGWTSDGVTLNASLVHAAGKRGFLLFVE